MLPHQSTAERSGLVVGAALSARESCKSWLRQSRNIDASTCGQEAPIHLLLQVVNQPDKALVVVKRGCFRGRKAGQITEVD